jgi:hypothetical protein
VVGTVAHDPALVIGGRERRRLTVIIMNADGESGLDLGRQTGPVGQADTGQGLLLGQNDAIADISACVATGLRRDGASASATG